MWDSATPIVGDGRDLCDNFAFIDARNMKPILNLFWQICLLRQSPAHVPDHTVFVAAVVIANMVGSVLVSLTADAAMGLLPTITAVLVNQATTAGLILAALSLKNLGERFPTTLTAVFGCDLMITACLAAALPIVGLWGEAGTVLAVLAYLVWSVAVAGFILHRALETPLAVGIGVAMAISLVSVTTSQLAVGAAP
jgi:hypothetical protein